MRCAVDIMARWRTKATNRDDRIAVRWTFSDPEWPENGFALTRTIGGVTSPILPAITLPGVSPAGAGLWTIDPAVLKQDLDSRRTVASGPDLPTLAEARSLIPVLIFALPKADPAALDAALDAVAEIHEQAHATDLALDTRYWRGKPPSLADLHRMRVGTPTQKQAYDAVIAFYRRLAVPRLLHMANDFGVARFLGLGHEDELPAGTAGPVVYRLETLATPKARGYCKALPLDALWKASSSPRVIEARQAHLGYPAFERFFANRAWKPRAPKSAGSVIDERTRVARRGPHDVATPTAKMRWIPTCENKPEDQPEEKCTPLLSREAIAWSVARYAFGRHTAADSQPPTLPVDAIFTECHPGERLLNQTRHSFTDGLDLPWGSWPLEGWYSYEVTGFDLFGNISEPARSAPLPLRDRTPPAPPRLRCDEVGLTVGPGAANRLTLHIDWRGDAELRSPDMALFRIRQSWHAERYEPLVVAKLWKDDPKLDPKLDPVQAKIRVTTVDNRDVPANLLAELVGNTLLTADGEYKILAAVSPAMRDHHHASRGALESSALIVSRWDGRAPPLGDAAVRLAGAVTHSTQIKEQPRSPAISAKVQVEQASPLIVSLLDEHDAPIAPGVGFVYLHLTGLDYRAEAASNGTGFLLSPPTGDRHSEAMNEAIAQLADGDVIAWLKDSPALWLPPHEIDLPLFPPTDFPGGRLIIEARAIDRATYVQSSGGPGNESEPITLVRAARPIAAPQLDLKWVPRIWARDAAEYADTALATIDWPPMDGAVRYEVDRAFEHALGLSPDVSDEDLIAAAEADPGAFERVGESVYGARFADPLPGRAPTRVVYRVRGVSAAGVAGGWGLVALVWVPDVRIAPQPSLLRAIPGLDADRSIHCSWAHPGPSDGIGFVIEARPVLDGLVQDEDWKPVADVLPGAIVADRAGRFDIVLPDRPPGTWHEYRVVACRHARDPDDPRGRALRRISGHPSAPMRARAKGALRPPDNLRADVARDGSITLRWICRDEYSSLEVREQTPNGWGFIRNTISARADHHVAAERLTKGEVRRFEIAAIGHGARALSEMVEAEWPSP